MPELHSFTTHKSNLAFPTAPPLATLTAAANFSFFSSSLNTEPNTEPVEYSPCLSRSFSFAEQSKLKLHHRRASLSFYPPQFWLAYLRASPSSVATKIGSTVSRGSTSLFPPVRTDRMRELGISLEENLTIVDLPGITRVPVHGQPENIYDQIKDIIMEYIRPEKSIILNVLSATVDFTTCESIRMSQSVDKTGLRTLAVVTKADKSPERLLEKVTVDDVNIGLGYVCIRNRIGDESYEEARIEEERLFESHPMLSKIDKSIVGVPVLAQRLVQVQGMIISKTLPEIVKKINEKLTYKLT
ncbi:Dynamin-related protein 4C [Arachis hypogaea]|nr:Dynamin-related protein 4C [Arachis hypogaea]